MAIEKSPLSSKELAALAMHELMRREQQRSADRINEQRRIGLMTDESLKLLVEGVAVPGVAPQQTNTKEK